MKKVPLKPMKPVIDALVSASQAYDELAVELSKADFTEQFNSRLLIVIGESANAILEHDVSPDPVVKLMARSLREIADRFDAPED